MLDLEIFLKNKSSLDHFLGYFLSIYSNSPVLNGRLPKSPILRRSWLGCQIFINFSSQSRSSHWEVFLKIGVHFSQVIIILMWTLVLYWNRSVSQEVNNLDNEYFYLKEQVSFSRIWGRLDIIFFCKQNITEKLNFSSYW